MKILLHDYAGHPFQVQLSRALAAQGHEVLHAFAGNLQTPRGSLTKKPTDPVSLEIREIPMASDYARHKYSFFRRRCMEVAYGKTAAALVAKWRPDVVLSSNTPTESQEALRRAAREKGARFVFWVQDFYSIAVDKLARKKHPLLGALVGRHYRRLERRQLCGSDHIVAITEDFVPIMIEEFGVDPSKITVIPNWAPLDEIPVQPKKNDWSEELGLSDAFVYLYTGTLGMKHNPDLLLQLALRHKDNPNVRVLVISEGLGADWLLGQKAAHALPNLHVLAYQPFHLMPQILASGDVLIAVLEEDAGIFSVPSKVLTYLCAERPLLLAVPAENLAARIIDQNTAGFTVRPSDTAGFLEKAEELRTQPALASHFAVHARRYAEKHFNIARIADQFASILA